MPRHYLTLNYLAESLQQAHNGTQDAQNRLGATTEGLFPGTEALGPCPALVTSSAQSSIPLGTLVHPLVADQGEFQVTKLTYLPSFPPANRVSLPTAHCPSRCPSKATEGSIIVGDCLNRPPPPPHPKKCLHRTQRLQSLVMPGGVPSAHGLKLPIRAIRGSHL